MESLKIIDQIGYNHFEKDDQIYIIDKNNNQSPLSYKHDICTDTDIYTDDIAGINIKINSFGDVEAEIGNGMRVKTERDCQIVKLIARGSTVLSVDFRISGPPINELNFDITVEDLFPSSCNQSPILIYSVDSNGLILRVRNKGITKKYDDRIEEFLAHMKASIRDKLKILYARNIDEVTDKVFNAVETLVRNRLSILIQSGHIADFKKMKLKELKGKKQ